MLVGVLFGSSSSSPLLLLLELLCWLRARFSPSTSSFSSTTLHSRESNGRPVISGGEAALVLGLLAFLAAAVESAANKRLPVAVVDSVASPIDCLDLFVVIFILIARLPSPFSGVSITSQNVSRRRVMRFGCFGGCGRSSASSQESSVFASMRTGRSIVVFRLRSTRAAAGGGNSTADFNPSAN